MAKYRCSEPRCRATLEAMGDEGRRVCLCEYFRRIFGDNVTDEELVAALPHCKKLKTTPARREFLDVPVKYRQSYAGQKVPKDVSYEEGTAEGEIIYIDGQCIACNSPYTYRQVCGHCHGSGREPGSEDAGPGGEPCGACNGAGNLWWCPECAADMHDPKYAAAWDLIPADEYEKAVATARRAYERRAAINADG